jgi:hypothetical protein
LAEKYEHHSLISTLLSVGDYSQWRKENERTLEELDRDLEIDNPDFLDIIIINCVFEVCMSWSDLLHDIIKFYRLTVILSHQNIVTPPPQNRLVNSIVYMDGPENRLQIYDSTFLNNKFNNPEVQVSLASSLAVSFSLLVVDCLAIRSPSPLFFSSSVFGIRRTNFWSPHN